MSSSIPRKVRQGPRVFAGPKKVISRAAGWHLWLWGFPVVIKLSRK